MSTIVEQLVQNRGRIFISCGQYAEHERRLGQEISRLVSKLTPYDPYFAENQSNLDGLTTGILRELSAAEGIIAVMHHRGEVKTPRGTQIRGSVWIEQEIGIAAFIQQVVGEKIEILLYVQKEIALEGMREQLLLHPTVFEKDDEVLEALRSSLPNWRPGKIRGPNLIPLMEARLVDLEGQRTKVNLLVKVHNNGNRTISRWVVDILIPRKGFDSAPVMFEYPQFATSTHRFIRVTNNNRTDPNIRPDETIEVKRIPLCVEQGFAEERCIVKVSGANFQENSLEKTLAELIAGV